MHKNPRAGKKTGARNATPRTPGAMPATTVGNRSAARRTHRQIPHSVKQLLTGSRALGQLRRRLTDPQTPGRGEDWTLWLRERLPAELAIHLSTVVRRQLPAPRGAQLVLFADSASWCARLRYALGALEGEIRTRDAAIGPIQVRVLMGSRG